MKHCADKATSNTGQKNCYWPEKIIHHQTPTWQNPQQNPHKYGNIPHEKNGPFFAHSHFSMEDYQWTQRFDRAESQRMYLVNSEQIGSDFEFSVMGNTDKIYKIVIGPNQKIKCSCPDCHRNHKFCKHLMLLLVRMLGMSKESVKTTMFTITDPCIDACVKYFSQKCTKQEPTELKKELRRPLDEDDCPICFEAFVSSEECVFCETCGKNVHKECFRKWNNTTCVYCRSAMEKVSVERISKKRKVEWEPE